MCMILIMDIITYIFFSQKYVAIKKTDMSESVSRTEDGIS